jgi:hypothetical protein
MPAPKLSERIEGWFEQLPIVGRAAAWVNDWNARRVANRQRAYQMIVAAFKSGQYGMGALAILHAATNEILGDIPIFGPDVQNIASGAATEAEQFAEDPQGYLQSKLNEAFSSPGTRAFAETVGTIITEPVLSLLEQYASDPNPDPHAMSRSFHGIASGLPWAAGIVDSVAKSVLGNRAPEVGKHIMALYWGLGLGFLGWQTLAPLLSQGLQPNLDRYYRRLYKPERFNPSQASDLFALGKYSAAQLQETLKDQGWRDADIALWVQLSYRSLNESVIWDSYHQGFMSKGEADTRLRSLGYDPKDIPLLYQLNPKEDEKGTPKELVGTAKAALKARLISEQEFRQILGDLNYAQREIDLQVQIIQQAQVTETRDLTTSQIQLLYTRRIIGRDEAVHNLAELGYEAQVAGQLVQAWDAASVPKAARINKSTILEAYTKGVLTREAAKSRLQKDGGYSAEDSELLVKTEETPFPLRVVEPEASAASLGLLQSFVNAQLITRAELADREEIKLYPEEDQERIISLLFDAASLETNALQLTPGILADAYVFGVLTREEISARLVALGMVEEDVEIYLRTVELENPQVFGEFLPQYLKLPSVGDLQLALQRELINADEMKARLEAQGYSPDAVRIHLFNAQYQAPAEPRELTKADILGLYADAIIGRAEAERRLIQIGYTPPDVELLIKRIRLNPEDTDAAAWFLSGFLDETGIAAILTGLDFSVEQIEDFLARAAAGEFGGS